jgi:hypothetical protein
VRALPQWGRYDYEMQRKGEGERSRPFMTENESKVTLHSRLSLVVTMASRNRAWEDVIVAISIESDDQCHDSKGGVTLGSGDVHN